MKAMLIKWELGHDRYGRRATLTREGEDYRIEIEPANQRDEGEICRSLSSALLMAAGEIAREQPSPDLESGVLHHE